LAVVAFAPSVWATDVACTTSGANQTLSATATDPVIGAGNGCTAVNSNFQNFNVSGGSGTFPTVSGNGAAAIEFPTGSIVSGASYTLAFTTTGQNTQDQSGTTCVALSWCGSEATAATTTQTISYDARATGGSFYTSMDLSDGTIQDRNPLQIGDFITVQENFCLGATSTTVGTGGCLQANSGYLLVTYAVGTAIGPLSGTEQVCTPGASACTLGAAVAGNSAYYHFAATTVVAVSDVVTIKTAVGAQSIFIDSFDNEFAENPEPSTFILMGSALVGVAALRFRKRRQA
jgi:hypothetical protein